MCIITYTHLNWDYPNTGKKKKETANTERQYNFLLTISKITTALLILIFSESINSKITWLIFFPSSKNWFLSSVSTLPLPPYLIPLPNEKQSIKNPLKHLRSYPNERQTTHWLLNWIWTSPLEHRLETTEQTKSELFFFFFALITISFLSLKNSTTLRTKC